MPPFRTDRNDRPGGGVIVYVRDTLLCKRRVDLEYLGVEGVWLELTIISKRIVMGGGGAFTGLQTAALNTSIY